MKYGQPSRLQLVLLGLLGLAVSAGTAQAQANITFSSGTFVVSGGGIVDLKGGTMTFTETGALSETNGGRVTGGLLTATRTLNAPSTVNVAGLGVEITSNADLGETTVTRGHVAQTGEGNQGILRFYDIAPSTNTGLDATLVFHYHDAELNGIVEDDLILFRSSDDGATWIQENGIVDTGANTITRTGIETFLSRWTAGGSGTPLPVELVAFEAVADGQAVLLQWATASETNNAGFEVQQKADDASCTVDGCAWKTLAFVAGAGTTAEARHYTHRIATVDPGTLHFRLKQVDFDGAFAYSPEVEVQVGLPQAYALSPVYPNPFNPEGRFTLAVREAQHVRIDVYDLLGRRTATVYEGMLEANRAHPFVVDAASLASGTYVIRASGEQFTASTTVSVVK